MKMKILNLVLFTFASQLYSNVLGPTSLLSLVF